MKLNLKVDQQLIRARIKVVCCKLLHLDAGNLMVVLLNENSHKLYLAPTALYINCSNNGFIIFHGDVKIKKKNLPLVYAELIALNSLWNVTVRKN